MAKKVPKLDISYSEQTWTAFSSLHKITYDLQCNFNTCDRAELFLRCLQISFLLTPVATEIYEIVMNNLYSIKKKH